MGEVRRGLFDQFARSSAEAMGSATAFVTVCGLTLLWLAIGPMVSWADAWQLTLTTTLTVATQLTAMLIQNSTTRNERAMQAKLDELIRSIDAADNRLRGIEDG